MKNVKLNSYENININQWPIYTEMLQIWIWYNIIYVNINRDGIREVLIVT